ncbi:uncharacterized protein LOC110735210 [Chenopodium quinoa]|uniref:uncharacterized protein LOC110735210 n=1 Tax=Chenopodium quinoa TaxID=63459 RepID=UPI000B76E050|nr:uncharacterized protein LOC110735210 [Chenopodium quinoa]
MMMLTYHCISIFGFVLLAAKFMCCQQLLLDVLLLKKQHHIISSMATKCQNTFQIIMKRLVLRFCLPFSGWCWGPVCHLLLRITRFYFLLNSIGASQLWTFLITLGLLILKLEQANAYGQSLGNPKKKNRGSLNL